MLPNSSERRWPASIDWEETLGPTALSQLTKKVALLGVMDGRQGRAGPPPWGNH